MNAHDRGAQRRTVRLFRNGRSQAVRIPKEFEFEEEEVVIERGKGGKLILEPVKRKLSLLEALSKLEPLPEEDWLPEIQDYPPEPVDLGFRDEQ